MMFKAFALAAALSIAPLATPAMADPAAPQPTLEYAFTAKVNVGAPVELGPIDGGRRRFIAITGGTVSGPLLSGTVMASGGDWQTIEPNGLTKVEAHYFLKAGDGTVIEVTNPGVRVASAEVTEKLAHGEKVDAGAYYFRTAPQFSVTGGKHDWLARHAFVARGVRLPDAVLIDVYVVR